MENFYNYMAMHSYYILLVISLIIWLGIFSYVKSINKKVSKMIKEKQQ